MIVAAKDVSRRGAKTQREREGNPVDCERSGKWRARCWQGRALLGKFPKPAVAGGQGRPANRINYCILL
jgi:hypothetical protein